MYKRQRAGDPRGREPRGQLLVAPFPAEVGAGHRRHRLPVQVRQVQRAAERGARVARSRLHPDPVERSIVQQPGVGHAVERDPAGHREAPLVRTLVQPTGELQEHLLQAGLDAGGEVGVVGGPAVPRRVVVPGQRLGVGAPVDRLHAEAAVAGRVDEFTQLAEVAWLAVRRECHHLVLVAGPQEAEVRGDLLVHQAERMRKLLCGEDGQLAVPVVPGQVGHGLAPAVADQHGRVAVRRGQPGRRGVGHVVGHVAHLRGVQARQRGGEERRGVARVGRAELFPVLVQAVLGGALQVEPHQLRVVGVRDAVQVLGSQACLREAPRGRLFGQFPRREGHRALAMLAAAEPLFLRGRYDLSVHDQGRCRIMKYGVDPQKPHRLTSVGPRESGYREERLPNAALRISRGREAGILNFVTLSNGWRGFVGRRPG